VKLDIENGGKKLVREKIKRKTGPPQKNKEIRLGLEICIRSIYVKKIFNNNTIEEGKGRTVLDVIK